MSYNEDKEPTAEDRRAFQKYNLETSKVPEKDQFNDMKQDAKPAETKKTGLKASTRVFKPTLKATNKTFTPSGSANKFSQNTAAPAFVPGQSKTNITSSSAPFKPSLKVSSVKAFTPGGQASSFQTP